jgi:Protein of unknown function (DUF1254)
VYGVALVEDVGKVVEQVTTPGIPLGAPLNAFGHGRELFDAQRGRELGLVGINTDTLYSWAQVDVGAGPVTLTVPDAAARCYVMQFADAWTNDFAYVGARATGTGAGKFLIVGPGWDGEAPDGMPVIHAPTAVFSIVGRWAVADPAELPAVHALQGALQISELSGGTQPASRPEGVWPYPTPDVRVPDDLLFWEKLRVWSQAFRPIRANRTTCGALRRSDSSPMTRRTSIPTPNWPRSCDRAEATGHGAVIEASTKLLGVRGQWLETRENFNFNQHFFELGTIATPDWRIADRERAWLLRARESLTAIWGNHAYEAYYPPCFHDTDGQPLTESTATGCTSKHHHRPTRSGQSRCMTSPATSSLITRSIATRSATARRGADQPRRVAGHRHRPRHPTERRTGQLAARPDRRVHARVADLPPPTRSVRPGRAAFTASGSSESWWRWGGQRCRAAAGGGSRRV